MKYSVEHYHRKLFGYKDVEDITAPDVPTVYDIEADSPLQAAKMAHAMYNDCYDFSTAGECPTRFEQYTYMIAEDREARKFNESGVFLYRYDDVPHHRIFVTENVMTNNF